ncbi:hypothetical protein ACLOJK_006037 [Asimina triloba]
MEQTSAATALPSTADALSGAASLPQLPTPSASLISPCCSIQRRSAPTAVPLYGADVRSYRLPSTVDALSGVASLPQLPTSQICSPSR